MPNGYANHGAESGTIAELHTWGQNLGLHPHIHCIVPAAGYSLCGNWKHIGKHKSYLYPVLQLGKVFSGKMLDGLKRKLKQEDLAVGFDTSICKTCNKRTLYTIRTIPRSRSPTTNLPSLLMAVF